MRRKLLIAGIAVTFILSGYYLLSLQKSPLQSSPKVTPSSQKSPKIILRYSGVLPCPDCKGVVTTLTLKSDNTYQISEIYQGKNDDEPFITMGTWKTETGIPSNSKALVYALRSDNGTTTYYVVINENEISLLDQDKKLFVTSSNTSLIRKK